MECILSPSWILTTEHSASNYGMPVLVNRGTGEGFGPGDIIVPYPSWGYMMARDAVKRLSARKKLKHELITKFCEMLTF